MGGRSSFVLLRTVDLAGQINLHRELARNLDHGATGRSSGTASACDRLLLERGERRSKRDEAEALVARYPDDVDCRRRIAGNTG